MEIANMEFDMTQRMCMPGMKAMAGQCIDQEVPGPQGKRIKAKLCACDSDLCNSANFNTQVSIFALVLSVTFAVMN